MPANAVPTIVEFLSRDQKPIPKWLDGDCPPTFDRKKFFSSHTVYYPGCGHDDQPVKLCALSHSAHTFVYVDDKVCRKTIVKRLQDPEQGFRGYEIACQEEITEDVLCPGGWYPHVSAISDVSAERRREAGVFRRYFAELSGLFVVLKRTNGGRDHGPRRLAILFIVGDGYASYDALYCQGDCTRPPYLALVQDHAWSGDWDRFRGGGVLERIAQTCDVWPEYLLVGAIGNHFDQWTDYEDTKARPEPGGESAIPRRLFRRDAVQGCG